jgi:hypothetical protein
MLLRLAYLAVTNGLAMLRLLPITVWVPRTSSALVRPVSRSAGRSRARSVPWVRSYPSASTL